MVVRGARLRDVEDLYPLTPLQQGMLFHTLYNPEDGAYITQVRCELEGELDLEAFRRAWQSIVERHAILRTGFIWEDLKEPLQMVRRTAEVSVVREDWRSLSSAERQERLAELLREDRRRGFLLARPPLIRLCLAQTAERTHQCVWSMHHILLDGWCQGVVLKEVVAFYEGLRQGREVRLDRPRAFRDYIAWMSRQDLGKAEEYWRETLAGFTAPTPLALDRPLSAGPGEAPGEAGGGDLHRPLGLRATERLLALARRGRLTVNTLVQGAWGLVLSRYGGETDVVFGSVVSGRPADLPGVESILGLFINTLPVRLDVSPRRESLEYLQDLQERQLEMRQYEYTPLISVQKWSEVPAGQTLFHSILAFESFPTGDGSGRAPGEGPSLLVRPQESSAPSSFPVTVSAMPGLDLLLGMSYFRRCLDRTTVERMLRHLAGVLEAWGEGEGRHLEDLPLLLEHERHQILLAWNDTRTDYARGACIHEIFAAQVERSPEATALVCGGESWTYRGLDTRADLLARHLRSLGVGPESLVAVAVERSAEMVVALLAVLKAGGAYLPLDPSSPPARLEALLGDLPVAALLTQDSLAGGLPAIGLKTMRLGAGWETGHSFGAPSAGASPLSLAYVIYTSGSTGRPKGVAVPHRAVVRLVRETGYADFSADQVFLQLAPLAFDASTLEIWGPLLNGGRLVVAPPGALSLEEIGDLIRRHGVTTLWLTSGLFHAMAEERPEDLGSLRQLLAGGDVLSPSHVERVLCAAQAGHHPLRVINGYGPTEGATFTCCHPMDPPGEVGRPVPLGRPIANTRVFAVDRELQPVPIGAPGELCIGGDGLARGYFGQPALTAASFVPDPFGDLFGGGAEPGGRLYRTGDLVRLLPQGRVEFLGRLDRQVKIRGFRIELGEVEAGLASHPAVREAVVLAEPGVSPAADRPADKRLVAYVTAAAGAPGTRLAPADLAVYLQQRLSDYLVPSSFVVLETLPLTANGKVDRRALSEIGRRSEALAREEGGAVAPRTPVEELVAGVWSEVLGIERIGAAEDFFQLGGHSLLATQVVSRLGKAFGLAIPLRALFEQPTVAGLARAVEQLQKAGRGVQPPPLEPVARDRPLPLSFAQQRLWFLDRLRPGSPVYNMPLPLRIAGPLHVPALARTLSELARRHEVLRTVFGEIAGAPVQVIAPAAPRPLPVIDLSGLPAAARRAAVRQLAGADALRPFDLARGPLLRVSLLRLAAEEHAALFTLHHIIGDAWSLSILTREMSALYRAFTAGAASPLSPLPELEIQYADFSCWQRDWLQGERLDEILGFWRRALAGAPPRLELPADRPRPAVQSARGAALGFDVPAATVTALQALCRRERVTLFMALLAGFQVLLSRSSGSPDISVGTPIAGRNQVEIEPLIGFFVNTLVLRTRIEEEAGFGDLLGRVRESTLEAYTHQDLPFEKLVEELQPERNLSHSPLFQVLFALQNAPQEAPRASGLAISPLPGESRERAAKFEMTLSMQEVAGGLRGELEYNTDLFDATTAARLAVHLNVLLAGAAAAPGDALSALSLLTPEERHQTLIDWNDTGSMTQETATIHGLFAAQAARAPDAVALMATDATLTYRELARRASCLARRLRALGVGPEVPVGVCLPRRSDLIVALLAVLEAGGAYVPLDPAFSQHRLAFQLADTGAPLLLTVRELAGALPEQLSGQAARLLVLDDLPTLLAESGEETAPAADAGNLAYVIYTSGSTGRPKGVAVEHRSAAALIHWAGGFFTAAELAGVLAATSINFDLSVFEIFAPLAWGGRVILADNALHLPTLPAASAVTLVNSVPSVLGELVQSYGLPASVRTVNLAGEALSGALAQVLSERPGIERVLNLYGPSEDTVYSTFCQVPRDERMPAIGRPIAGTRAYLLDPLLRPVLPGSHGELCLGGAGLARGYLRRPDQTAERFIPDPFAEGPGERLYRTGDLARSRADGSLESLGRIDHQVKVRGFRIEPGEIEAALLDHPAVRAAVVLARGDGDGGGAAGRRLVAYVTPAGLAAEELRAHLRQRLPDYMVPAQIVGLDALPLTATGKVDRRALPTPEAPMRQEDGAAPRTATEEVLAAIWSDVLKVERVGRSGHFFELGGHSLLATQVASRIGEAFGVALPVRVLFEHPTVAALAGCIEALRRGEEGSTVARIARIPRIARGGPLPLSFAQQRLWFLDQLQPGSPAYNMPLPLRIAGPLHVPALARALSELARRHEVLRTAFQEIEGAPVQVVAPAVPQPLPLIDLGGLPERARREAALGLARADALRPFDLARGPLLRVALLRLAAEEHAALFAMHHIAGDAWSLGILTREMSALYQAFAAGAPSPLPELEIQYADFAAWQRDRLRGAALDEILGFWRRTLEGAPPRLELPADRARPAVQGSRGAALPFEVPAGLTAALVALGRGAGATPFMTLLAAFQTLLARFSGSRDLIVGTPVAGRNRIETEPLIGCFVNTLVLRTRLDGGPSFRELLGAVRTAALDAYAHQDLPFEKLVEELQPERDLSHTPLFQVLFALQNAPREAPRASGLSFVPLATEGEERVAKHELSLALEQRAGGLAGSIEYLTDLYDAATIARLAGAFTQLLAAAAADPAQPVLSLPLLAASEWAQSAAPRNAPAGRAPARQSILPRTPLEAQVVRIWEDLLGTRPVGVEDSFFDLGGHSLLAVRLMARLEQLTGRRLPVSALFREPTPAHLARLLQDGAVPPPRSPLVPIQPRGGKPPIFWVHGAGGNVFSYQALASHLGPDQPAYGLQSPGLDGEEPPLTTIQDMAARYVEAVRAFQPAGPYRLGGWSMGGVVAFEMACQLAAQGEAVDPLILLDSRCPAPAERALAADDRSLLAPFARELGIELERLPLSWAQFLELDPSRQLACLLEQAKAAELVPPDLGLRQVTWLYEVFRANSRAMLRYVPRRFAGRVLLLLSSETIGRRSLFRKPTLGWGRVSAHVDVHRMPGGHFTLLRPPHVQTVATTIISARSPESPRRSAGRRLP